jgi:hypothetical protein
MRILRTPLIVLALTGLIALSGCGGGDSSDSSTSSDALSVDEYTTQVQQALTDFGTQFTTLGTQIQQAKTSDELSGLVDQAETEIQGAIDDFDAIQPPDEAQEGHDQIIAALEDFSSKLTDVSEAADSGDKSSFQDAAAALQQAGTDFGTQLQEAAQSLSDAGINLGAGSGASSSGG